MIAVELLALVPDDDPTYLDRVAVCLAAGRHPAVAAVQAHVDLAHALRKGRCPMPRGGKRKPIRHGTNAGYTAHRRHGVEPCDDCLAAHREYQHRNRPTLSEQRPNGLTCDTCGVEFGAQGIRRHERACAERHARRQQARTAHTDAATPIAPPRGREPRLPTTFGRAEPSIRIRLECECGHVTDTAQRLITHTLTEHGRGPTRAERTPRTTRKDVA